MFKKTLLVIAILAVATLAPITAQENAEVSIIHGIPGENGLPVDVEVLGVGCIEDFTFGTVAGPLSLPPATYTVSIKLPGMTACGGTTAIGPADIEFLAGENASVIAHLTEMGDLTASKFTNDVSPTFLGQSRLIARHTAAAGAVDIALDRGRGGSVTVSNVQNTQGVGYDVGGGRRWSITLFDNASGAPVLGPAPVALRPSTVTILYAVGDPAADTFTVIADSINLR
jgi:hypothetical protein